MMVMDATTAGVAGKLAVWGGVLLAALALAGAVASNARNIAEINTKLDRNCRILATLDQDLRLHILVDLSNDRRRERNAHGATGSPGEQLAAFPNVSC